MSNIAVNLDKKQWADVDNSQLFALMFQGEGKWAGDRVVVPSAVGYEGEMLPKRAKGKDINLFDLVQDEKIGPKYAEIKVA